MDRIEIGTWANIRAESWNSLLLGNGASIAIHHSHIFMLGGESYRLKQKIAG